MFLCDGLGMFASTSVNQFSDGGLDESQLSLTTSNSFEHLYNISQFLTRFFKFFPKQKRKRNHKNVEKNGYFPIKNWPPFKAPTMHLLNFDSCQQSN